MAVSDTTKAVIQMTAAADKITGRKFYTALHWVSKSAIAGDDLLVVDGDGDTVWEEVSDGSNFSKLFPINNYVTDLTLQTRDSGTLYAIQGQSVKNVKIDYT